MEDFRHILTADSVICSAIMIYGQTWVTFILLVENIFGFMCFLVFVFFLHTTGLDLDCNHLHSVKQTT